MKKNSLLKGLDHYKKKKWWFRSNNIRIDMLSDFMNTNTVKLLGNDDEILVSDFICYLNINHNQHEELFTEEYLKSKAKSAVIFREFFGVNLAPKKTATSSSINNSHAILNQLSMAESKEDRDEREAFGDYSVSDEEDNIVENKSVKFSVRMDDANQEAYEKIQLYLKKLKWIRVIVQNSGRGFGNQAAAVTVILHLIDLGYEGNYHICFNKKNGTKVEAFTQLLKAYPEISHRIQWWDDESPLEFVPLAVSGADDNLAFYKKSYLAKTQFRFQCGALLCLQPTGWLSFFDGNKRWLRLPGQDLIALQHDAILHTHYSDAKELVIRDPLHQAFLDALKYAYQNQTCLTQSIYGLYPDLQNKFMKKYFTKPLDVMRLLTETFLCLQHNSEYQNNPIILFVHLSLPRYIDIFKEEFSLLHKRHPDSINIVSDFAESIHAIKTSKGNQITICLLPSMPKNIFEAVLLHSILPRAMIESCVRQ